MVLCKVLKVLNYGVIYKLFNVLNYAVKIGIQVAGYSTVLVVK